MFLNISKHLTVHIITTTTFFITVLLVSTSFSTINSLPITSKPIESTAENLAWEAWLMVPVNQQQKTRKVTPKSIFIVPQKKNQSSCPPGEHFFENRCIPHVSIDQDQLLLDQLNQLVSSDSGFPGQTENTEIFEYDYEEEEIFSPSAEKLEGSADSGPTSITNIRDEPLKFNIFRDTFPIGPSGSGDSSGNKDSEDENIFFVSERRRKPPVPFGTSDLPDLDTESSNSYGSQQDQNLDDDSKIANDSSLFLSGIDAILVPAISKDQGKNQNLNFSVYQETNKNKITNSETQALAQIAAKNITLDQVLENDSLFVDKNHNISKNDTVTTERNENTTELELETTTMKLEEEEDIESKTEFTRSITDIIPTEDDTTILNDSTDITSTLSITDFSSTNMIPSDETTMVTSLNDDITTISEAGLQSQTSSTSETDTTFKSTMTNIAETTIPPSEIDDRFLYHSIENKKNNLPVINMTAELKKINDLVAGKIQPSTTTISPNMETTIKTNSDLLINTISTPQTIPTTLTNSASTTTNSSIRNNTRRTLLSSSSSSTITSSPESQESQESTQNQSTSIPSTPEITDPDPYWWLPTGWRGDQTSEDRPLLLRFWSALSGFRRSETKG